MSGGLYRTGFCDPLALAPTSLVILSAAEDLGWGGLDLQRPSPMHEEIERQLGGLRVVTLGAPEDRDAAGPSFASARVLPDRGMMTLQVAARLPGRGEVDLLWTPPAAEAGRLLAAGTDGFPGNGSYLFGGAILLPFANRIAGELAPDGRTIRTKILGRTVELPANAGGRRPGARRFAMHGFLLDARADELSGGASGGADRVRAVYRAGDFGGRWLSATEAEIECALDRSAFRVAVAARNAGNEPLPMGIGWHPYFALPSGRREQARLHIPARRRALVGDYDEVLPTGELQEVAGTPYDFTDVSEPGGRPLGGLYLDDCFVDLARGASGEVAVELVDPAAAYGLRVVGASPRVRAVQVYAPPAERFVVVEPQMNLADPFGAEWEPGVDTGMAVLAPGESVVYAARLELFRPAVGGGAAILHSGRQGAPRP